MNQEIISHICGHNGNHFYHSLKDLAIHKYGEQIDLVRGMPQDEKAKFMLYHIAIPLYLEHELEYCLMFLRVIIAHELFMYIITGKCDEYMVNMCNILSKRCWILVRQQKLLEV